MSQIQILIYLIFGSNNCGPHERITFINPNKDENNVQVKPKINLCTRWVIMNPSLKFQSKLNITLTLFVQVS
jgi:hypothetical protein